jgi:hypothetical protein
VNKIIIEIDDSVTKEQREDPRFKKLLQDCEKEFNDPRSDLLKLLIGLHESGHGYFARKSGATNIYYRGPKMMWDSRPEYNCPAISRSAIVYTRSPNASVIENIKISLAGYIVRRELSGYPNDAIAIGSDLGSCRDWFYENIGEDEAVFNAAVADAEREILIDLRSPKTRREIWDEARRFVAVIFPKRSEIAANKRKMNQAA